MAKKTESKVMSKDKELEELKSALRSMVVSSPTAVDARCLARDYCEMMGVPLPLRRYGHHSLADFLRNHCQDCFKLQGAPDNPTLILIVPDNLKHIDKFVRSQRIAPTAKHKGKRYSVPGNTTANCNTRNPKRNNIVNTEVQNKSKPIVAPTNQLEKLETPCQDHINIATTSQEDQSSVEQSTSGTSCTFTSDAHSSDELMHFLESVPAAPLPALGQLLRLRLGESFPAHDWVLQWPPPSGLQPGPALAAAAQRPAHYAAARCAGRWWRALLLDATPQRALVRLVDCGALLAVGWDDVRALPRRWALQPAAAFRARLLLPAGVRRAELRARSFLARVTAREEELVVLQVEPEPCSGRVRRLMAARGDLTPPERPMARRLSLLRAVAVD